MTAISEQHVNWAVVHRLGAMLSEPADRFEVTESYALFTTILCWVMQHIRNHRDAAASALFRELNETPITRAPWNIVALGTVNGSAPRSNARSQPASGFGDHSIGRLLENLRNAVAHGDGRRVRPVNRHGALTGFKFSCSEKGKETKKVTWRDSLTLDREQMRRIGVELAQLYCAAVADGKGSEFTTDARTVRERRAA